MKSGKSTHGFATVEAVLIIIVLGIVGFTGWFVYHSKQIADKTLSSDPGSSVTFPKKAATTQTPSQTTDTQKYLDIKEWAFRIPLSSTIESTVYSSGQYSTGTSSATGGSIKLGLVSLGSDCSNSSKAPLGEYVEFTQKDVSEEDVTNVSKGPSLHDLMKSAVEVPGSDGGYGAYYVAYVKPTTDCSNGGDTSAVNAATVAFAQALQGTKPGDQ